MSDIYHTTYYTRSPSYRSQHDKHPEGKSTYKYPPPPPPPPRPPPPPPYISFEKQQRQAPLSLICHKYILLERQVNALLRTESNAVITPPRLRASSTLLPTPCHLLSFPRKKLKEKEKKKPKKSFKKLYRVLLPTKSLPLSLSLSVCLSLSLCLSLSVSLSLSLSLTLKNQSTSSSDRPYPSSWARRPRYPNPPSPSPCRLRRPPCPPRRG